MSKARQLADLGNVYDDGALSNRNLIINGDMRIDQRNGGASVTGSSAVGKFAADRFSFYANTTGVMTIQQVSDAPSGFEKSNKITCTTAATGDNANSRVQLYQSIEGYNIAQLELGTSNAKAMTLSFWVKASNAGTYGGSFANGVIDKSYPYQYTINAANTWEYKTVTITGDTSGTWATGNTHGLTLFWSMGVGSTYEGPANQWNGAFDIAPPSSFSLKDNLNATWQITGVQLEVGDTATPFEHRSYGQELALCQRYAYVIADGISGNNAMTGLGFWNTSTQGRNYLQYPVTMRAVPTFSVDSLSSITQLQVGVDYQAITAVSVVSETNIYAMLFITTTTGGTTGEATACRVENGGKVIIDAEL